MKDRTRWFDQPAGPGLRLVLFAVIGAAVLITLSGCGVVKPASSPEEKAWVEQRHNNWIQRMDNRRDLRRSNWNTRHGVY